MDVETALTEAGRLRRQSIILFAAAIAIAFAGLFLVFHPALEAWPWLDKVVVRVEYVVVFGLIGVAGTFSLLDFYTRYSIDMNGKALVFSRREKLAYTMIIWLILGITVVSILWYQWGPNFILMVNPRGIICCFYTRPLKNEVS